MLWPADARDSSLDYSKRGTLNPVIALLTVVFVLSGAAGLIYESIWSRYLSLLVGHSAYAQIIVLVIFLGGMSLGALLVGQRSDRLRRPLLWYAGVEAVVGLIGVLFNYVYVDISDLAYDTLFPALAGGWSLIVVKWLLAAIMILPQSILLGTTFPLMSAGAIRLIRARTGQMLGLLYFANSLGAAIGVLVAGFVLLARVGLPGTLVTAAILNFIAATAVLLGLRLVATTESTSAVVDTAGLLIEANETQSTPVTLLLWVSFGTAVASFIYEIAWIRMLSLVLGSATHSFELMLSAFILGLALGAFWIRSRADRVTNPLALLGAVQCVMGMLAVATLPLYVASFSWVATLLDTFRQSDAGYRGFLAARYAICLLVMLPATFCAGITLPLITKMLMDGGGRVRGERAIGAVYGLNTLGSIAGVLLAGLVLMPLLGLKLLLIAGALVDIGLGLTLLLAVVRDSKDEAARPLTRLSDPASRLSALTVGIAAFVALVAIVVDFDPVRLTSGVYRYAVLPRKGDYTVPFYRDGRTATVSIRRMKSGFLTLSTNGKPDASMDEFWRNLSFSGPPQALERDIATQVLLPVVTLAHRPNASEVAVIGQGSGMTSHLLLGSPNVKHLATIEIEPQMIAASRAFYPANRRVFDDPRAAFVLDDAKSYFAASGRRFDLILSEPSNPWVSGVSGLFTTEFYRRVRTHLADGGVFGQWLHLYELDDALATMVLAALDQNFPSYEIFFTSNADILIVASNAPALPTPDWRVVDFPGLADDLRRAIPLTADALDATRLAGRQLLHPYLSTQVGPNSDYHPALDLGAERTRYLKNDAEGLSGFGEGRFDIAAALAAHRRPFGTTPLSVAPEITHVDELARGARLRALLATDRLADTTVKRDEEDAKARVQLDQLERLLRGAAPPADWRLWVEEMRESERLVHGGTAGVVDESFYQRLRAYAGRVNAPAPARAAIAFLHGLASWDFNEASRAGQALIDARIRDTVDWLPISLVRNGTVVARIELGDFDGARAAFKAYSQNLDSDPFTARVLAAYLLDQERRRVE
ncbi:MAG: fused MFS/spermidine synthase [Gemmatimonadaceae bacterium]